MGFSAVFLSPRMSAIFLGLSSMLFTLSADAGIRPIFIPGDRMAIIMLQAVSSTSPDMDLEPREFYDAIGSAEQDGPGGGKGKVIGSSDKGFTLSCGWKMTPENVTCTINIKPTSQTKVSGRAQVAEAIIEGPEAARFFTFFAGPAAQPFVFETRNRWIYIEARPERFYFRFDRAR